LNKRYDPAARRLYDEEDPPKLVVPPFPGLEGLDDRPDDEEDLPEDEEEDEDLPDDDEEPLAAPSTTPKRDSTRINNQKRLVLLT
jgi:hypothetical protein